MKAILPAGWPQTLNAIVRGPGAWATVAQLAERMHVEEEVAKQRCEDIEEAGWISRFAWDGADVFTLSQGGAELLQVELVPDPDGEGEHWARRGRGVALQGTHFDCEGRIDRIELVPDTQLQPDEQAILTEAIEARAAAIVARFERRYRTLPSRPPRPTIMLMGCETVWREWGYSPRGCNVFVAGRWQSRSSAICVKLGILPRAPQSCSCCKLRPLGNSTTCLRCSRYGWAEPRAKPKPQSIEKVA